MKQLIKMIRRTQRQELNKSINMGETTKEEIKEVITFLVVCIVGFGAACLAFAAEAKRIKVSDIETIGFGCNYPSSPASTLGYVAAFLLLVTQVIITVTSRRACCQIKTSINSRSDGAVVTFVISWITSITGIVLLIVAASLSTRREFLDATGLCYTVRRGLFGTGGALAMISSCMGLCTASFLTKFNPQFSPASIPYIQNGIDMGNKNPHFVQP